MLDTLIRGAKIVDGTGKAAFTADVGILDGMIEAVGNLSGAQAFETIEAAGRIPVSYTHLDVYKRQR